MIEPPKPGFTGVIWEAREAGRLAQDLTTGPGPVPMAEAGLAWARLAVGFGAAAIEYEQIIATLRGAWQSSASESVHQQVAKLRDWLADAAVAAGSNAAKAEAQAAAYELARLTMPNAAHIAAIEAVQRSIEQIGAAMGAPIKAVAAATDTEADAAKATASRVMRVYEAATEPLATPWAHTEPPVLTAGASLEAERGGTPLPQPPTATVPTGMPAMPAGFGMGPTPVAPVKTEYRAPVYAQSGQASEVRVPQQITVPVGEPATPMPAAVPPGAAAAAAAQTDEEHRAGLVAEGADVIGLEGGIVSAPAVLGAPPETAAPAAAPEAGRAIPDRGES
ncbi:PPE family protein [Nocardia sp. CDC159]|uniref:PPE family protein n=1 Tax=Nocardia pulmonis TaxID=2951408 RepID=A0A9X2IYV5_9NOCA|nr:MULTISPECIES: PPE domain-containing protein [Nocardia]MCM6776094.1 PPE family protein [Nocardia pulmonis]MCM6788579.1 PPE family protein [Nocardia sp. CDC159]